MQEQVQCAPSFASRHAHSRSNATELRSNLFGRYAARSEANRDPVRHNVSPPPHYFPYLSHFLLTSTFQIQKIRRCSCSQFLMLTGVCNEFISSVKGMHCTSAFTRYSAVANGCIQQNCFTPICFCRALSDGLVSSIPGSLKHVHLHSENLEIPCNSSVRSVGCYHEMRSFRRS